MLHINLDVKLPLFNGGKSPRWGGESARRRTSQRANKPGGKRARGRISQAQGANHPGTGGKLARGRTSQGQKSQGEKAKGWTSQGANEPGGNWQRGKKARRHIVCCTIQLWIKYCSWQLCELCALCAKWVWMVGMNFEVWTTWVTRPSNSLPPLLFSHSCQLPEIKVSELDSQVLFLFFFFFPFSSLFSFSPLSISL